ncbi:MAG: endo-1,4-beta-xylanase [Treponema sp.]|jgi:endo-1,4-beta-xylanase|nr:endo-1,4-beta-xylanase [Treponema sp.]
MKVKQSCILLLLVFVFLGCHGKEEEINHKEEINESKDILSLPPMKDQFAEYFLMGNIFNPGDASAEGIINQRLTRHYNVLTAENNMKPGYLAPATKDGSYRFDTADTMVNAAIASGFKVVGHTLLWHSQNAGWMNTLSLSTALEDMKKYITDVVTHFNGRIYSWDVLNEVFPDGVSASANWKTSMRNENPWFKNIGSDFVYEGFKAARLADSGAILYYNDYNLNDAGKATMVRNMVHDVNEEWKNDSNYDDRKLIEGIGMQSHHNTGITSASVKASLELFKTLRVKISITELDVLAQSWGEYSGKSPVKKEGLEAQAKLYGEYMKLFLEYSDIIERVSFWGVTDDKSWRSGGLPLLFDPDGMSKPSYYAVIDALNEYEKK